VRELLSQETLTGEARLINKYLKPDLFIIEDMGLESSSAQNRRPLGNHHASLRKPFHHDDLELSNREWGKLLSDVPAAGAILDRLLHHAEIFAISDRSYRFQPNPKQSATKTNRSSA
jgi:DNA replication protein DnaC